MEDDSLHKRAQSTQAKYARVRQMLRLERPDRLPIVGDDLRSIEYRPDIYHLGEMEHVERGVIDSTRDGRRKVTWDGGVWAVDAKDKYDDYDDVLAVDIEQFAVEPIAAPMLNEMRRLYDERAEESYPYPWH